MTRNKNETTGFKKMGGRRKEKVKRAEVKGRKDS